MSLQAIAAGSLMAVVLVVATALALWYLRREKAEGRGARYRKLRDGDQHDQGGDAGDVDDDDGDGDEAHAAGTNGHTNGHGKHSSGPAATTLAAHGLLDEAEAALAGGDAVAALRMIDDACLLAGEDPMVLRRAEVLRSRVA